MCVIPSGKQAQQDTKCGVRNTTITATTTTATTENTNDNKW